MLKAMEQNERSLCTNARVQMCVQLLGLATAYKYAHQTLPCLHGPLQNRHSHPRVPVDELVSLTSLAELLGQLVIKTVLPPSPLALHCCVLTICGNWLGSKRHVTHKTGDPKILLQLQLQAFTVVFAMRWRSVERRRSHLLRVLKTHRGKVGPNGKKVLEGNAQM